MSKIQQFYDRSVQNEWDRLGVRHRTEFAVTQWAMKDFLPSVPARIIDIGGGPGRYALWLAGQGYHVALVDLSEGNLAFARQRAADDNIHLDRILQANAIDLSFFSNESFDVALVMGPLYHLLLHEERLQALREAWRVLKPGGLVFATFLSRFAAFRDAAAKGAPWVLERPETTERILKTGVDINEAEGFTDAYFAHPDEVVPLVESAGFSTLLRLGCEGAVAGHETYVNSLEGRDFDDWTDLNYRLGKDPTAIGASDHILYIGRKPEGEG